MNKYFCTAHLLFQTSIYYEPPQRKNFGRFKAEMISYISDGHFHICRMSESVKM